MKHGSDQNSYVDNRGRDGQGGPATGEQAPPAGDWAGGPDGWPGDRTRTPPDMDGGAAGGWAVSLADWPQIHGHILDMERRGLVTRTFRRLDPERQFAVIQAILDEAIARGPAGLNVRQVAGRAGLAVGSLYTYFPKREGLLAFAVELCTRYMADVFTNYGPMLAAMPLQEALPAFMLGGIEWSRASAGLTQFFARAAYQGESPLTEQVVRPVGVAMVTMMRDMLSQAAARGELRPDLDLEATSRVVYALVVAVSDSQLLPYLNAYFQVTGGDVTSERAMAAAMSLILQGLGKVEQTCSADITVAKTD